jgi:hypothetical protein
MRLYPHGIAFGVLGIEDGIQFQVVAVIYFFGRHGSKW